MWNYLPATIMECVERLKQAQIENNDTVELIRRYNDKDTLIYCDPPYLPSLRKRSIYACEMNEQKHIDLLHALKDSSSMIVVSGYDSELYNRELSGWNTDTIETTAQFGFHRTEKIWANFDFDRQIKLK